MAALFGFGQSADVQIKLVDEESRKKVDIIGADGGKQEYFLFRTKETVKGIAFVTLKKPNQNLEHCGIFIEFIGQIETGDDHGNHDEFVSMYHQVAVAGSLAENQQYSFEFKDVKKPFETYHGTNANVRYFLRVIIKKSLFSIKEDLEIAVQKFQTTREIGRNLEIKFGFRNSLLVDFTCNNSSFHTKDTIVGQVYFMNVGIKVKAMEVEVFKVETTGSYGRTVTAIKCVTKMEVMDGSPVRGETIPIRVFLAPLGLTPTMCSIRNKFSVKWVLKLSLIDEEHRMFYQEQEIHIYRKVPTTSQQPSFSLSQ